MTKKELQTLRIGDSVIISVQGNNRGKRGIVDNIVKFGDYRGEVYLTPVDCEFTFYNPRTRRKNKNGLYGFGHQSIQLCVPKKESMELQIYCFTIISGLYSGQYQSVVTTSEEEARKKIWKGMFNNSYTDEIVNLIKVLPIKEGTLI